MIIYKAFSKLAVFFLCVASTATLAWADPPETKQMLDGSSISKPSDESNKPNEAALSESDHAAAVSALSEREKAYFKAVFAKERDQIESFLDNDAIFFDDGAYRGKGEYLRIMQPYFDGKFDFTFEAEPDEIYVARSGELGWTIGESRTFFVRPGSEEKVEFKTRYLMVWTRSAEGEWMVRAFSTLVVHPSRGEAAEPRSALMMAWPPLGDMIDAKLKIEWEPEISVRAASGESAFTFGQFHSQFVGKEKTEAGIGFFVNVWKKDDKGRWQLAGEGYSPPQIYGSDDG